MADNDLFGDSSSDADTDDLIAAAKSQPIARKKNDDGAPAKKKAKKSSSEAPPPDADDDDDESDVEAGLFDSSSEEEDEGPKKKKLGKKKRKAPKKSSVAPAKKDTRSKQERMEALARRRAAESGGGDGTTKKKKEPRKKRSKKDGSSSKGKDGEEKDKTEEGYKSGDSYDSETFQRTKDDDDFIDADDEDPDAIKELYAEQHFEDERPDGYDSEEEEKKKKKATGRKSSGSKGGGLDKISLSDDEGDETTSASNALKAAVKRMQKKKKEVKKLSELEEEGMAFLKLMEEAADSDDESIKNKKMGVKKMAMLQQVMDTLARKDMVRVLLDLDLLSVCKRWIQPLPNGTLGNVTLRRRIMECIAAMSGENGINSYDLKKSGFGKVVMALYMHKSETPEMKKMLKGIIEQWSRPIFQKSGNMRDLEMAQKARGYNESGSLVGIARAQQLESKQDEKRRLSGGGGGGGSSAGRGVKTEDELNQIITEGSKSTREIGNNRVRVPYSKGFQYSVRPQNRMGDVSDKRNLVSAKAAATNTTRDSEKRDLLAKKMADKSRKTNKQSQRSANISIEGRAVK